MTDPTDDPRRYSDEEFARVLYHALQLQENRSPVRSRGEGLTLAEMRDAAREAGIDPELVDRAVALLPATSGSTADRVLGGPTRYRLARSAAVSATSDQMARIVDGIRGELGVPGRVDSELDGLAWQTEGEPSQLHVTLTPGSDRTEIRVAVNRDAAFILTWFMPVTGGLVLAGITGGAIDPATAAEGAVIVGTGLAGGLTLARTLWARSTRIVRERAQRVMDLIERELGE